jgi:hypothetical protein
MDEIANEFEARLRNCKIPIPLATLKDFILCNEDTAFRPMTRENVQTEKA